MARDYEPRGSMGWRESAEKLEWPMTRVTDGATVYVTNKRPLSHGSSVMLVDDADTGETYRAGPKLGQVEPHDS